MPLFISEIDNTLTGGGVTGMTLSVSASSTQLVVVEGYTTGGSSSVPVSSVSDDGGNTWAVPGGYPSNTPPAAYNGSIGAFLAYCNVSSTMTQVTVAIPTASELAVCISVYDGVQTSFPLRQGTNNIGTSISLSVLGGGLVVGGANTSNRATSISGLSTLMANQGNVAGYGLPGSDETVTVSWSPSHSGDAAIFAEFFAGTTIINGTATLKDTPAITATASITSTASLTESEMITATPGANPHVAFSAVTPNQNDPNGIPLIHGLTAYHYSSTTATQYDYWMSLQDGQLAAGLYGAAANSGLTVTQSVPTWTDSGGKTLGMVRSYNADSTSNLASFTTEADVPGATVTNVVITGSNATVIVHGQFDFLSLNPSAGVTFIGFLNWNGSDRSQQCVFEAGSVTARACCARTWRITGVTAGTYTAKLRASCSTNSANNVVEFPHTGLVVEVIDM